MTVWSVYLLFFFFVYLLSLASSFKTMRSIKRSYCSLQNPQDTPSHNCVLYLIHIYQSQDCISYVSECQLASSSHSLQDPVRLSHRIDITQYRRLQSSKRSKEDLVRQPSETILNGLFPGDSHPTWSAVTSLSPTRGSRPLCMVKGNRKED